MTLEWTEETLCRAARQMTQGLAAALRSEDVPSPAPAERLRRVTRRARWRRLGQRAAMIALTAVLAFGAVLAVSPQARAAVGRWLFLLTENRALYQFLVEMESSRAQPERMPRWLPEGLSPEKTAVHGMIAHFYRFPENTARYGQEGYLLAFYDQGTPRYSVVLPERSTALVWIDEDTGAVFLLTGGLEEDILVRIAESMYETGGETA